MDTYIDLYQEKPTRKLLKKMDCLTKNPDCVFVMRKDGKNIELYEDSSSDCTPLQITVLVPIILVCLLFFFYPNTISPTK